MWQALECTSAVHSVFSDIRGQCAPPILFAWIRPLQDLGLNKPLALSFEHVPALLVKVRFSAAEAVGFRVHRRPRVAGVRGDAWKNLSGSCVAARDRLGHMCRSASKLVTNTGDSGQWHASRTTVAQLCLRERPKGLRTTDAECSICRNGSILTTATRASL